MRDRSSSTSRKWALPTTNEHHVSPGHSSAVELIDDGLEKVTISSGDSIMTIEPFEGDDTSSWGQNEARPFYSIPAAQTYLEPWRKSRASANPASHGTFLSWRSDPIVSLSDWTLSVVVQDGDRTVLSTLYHCHSTVLVWGPRKCDMFIDLFQQRMKIVPPPRSTMIELSYTEAEVFPMLLDFLYCETTFALSADSICALYSVASKFESEMLQIAIQTFVEQSLDFDQSIDFLSCGRHHPDREKIEKLILFTNSKICGYLVKNPTKASKVPPTILAHILHKRSQVLKVLKGGNPRKFSGDWELGRSRILSSVVANCCVNASRPRNEGTTEEEKLSRMTFEQLIHPRHLPAINCEAALSLLKVDSILTTQEGGKDGSALSSQSTLNSFEYRCVDAIVAGWTNILAREKEAHLFAKLSAMKPVVLANILIEVSRQYEKQVTNLGTPRTHDILQNMPSNRDPIRPAQKEASGISLNKAAKDDDARPPRGEPIAQGDWIFSANSATDDDSGSLSYSTDRYGVSSEER